MELSYKLAAVNDFDDVYELYMDEDANPFLTYDPMDRHSFEDKYRELLVSRTLYVVRSGKEIVGTYRLIPKANRQSHILYLGGFTVKKSWKGKGFGSKILSHIKDVSKDLGFRRIELTVDVHNLPAISLYKKIGFQIEGTIRMSYRLSTTNQFYDEYLMGLIL